MSDKQNTGLHQVRRLPRTIVSKSQYNTRTIMPTSSTASGQQQKLVCKKKSKLLYKRNRKHLGLKLQMIEITTNKSTKKSTLKDKVQAPTEYYRIGAYFNLSYA